MNTLLIVLIIIVVIVIIASVILFATKCSNESYSSSDNIIDYNLTVNGNIYEPLTTVPKTGETLDSNILVYEGLSYDSVPIPFYLEDNDLSYCSNNNNVSPCSNYYLSPTETDLTDVCWCDANSTLSDLLADGKASENGLTSDTWKFTEASPYKHGFPACAVIKDVDGTTCDFQMFGTTYDQTNTEIDNTVDYSKIVESPGSYLVMYKGIISVGDLPLDNWVYIINQGSPSWMMDACTVQNCTDQRGSCAPSTSPSSLPSPSSSNEIFVKKTLTDTTGKYYGKPEAAQWKFIPVDNMNSQHYKIMNRYLDMIGEDKKYMSIELTDIQKSQNKCDVPGYTWPQIKMADSSSDGTIWNVKITSTPSTHKYSPSGNYLIITNTAANYCIMQLGTKTIETGSNRGEEFVVWYLQESE